MQHIENLIIGAGPGGLQLAHDFKNLGRNYLVLEKAAQAGDFFSTYPRHRQLISINKVYSDAKSRDEALRFDWNSLLCNNDDLLFKNYNTNFFPPADDLVKILNDFAKFYELNINYDSEVLKIERKHGIYHVTIDKGDVFIADRLYVATGRWKPRTPDFIGVEHCENYDTFSIDPKDFENQRVIIIGKGNSAFETADCLMSHTKSIHMCSPTPIRLAWKTHYVGHLRAVNNGLLDTYQLKSGNTILDAHVLSVTKSDDSGFVVRVKYVHAEDQTRDIAVDRVLLCAGFMFDNSIFAPDCIPDMTKDEKFPLVQSNWQSANQSNMFFVGNLSHGLDYEKTFSGFIHGFRYNSRALAHLVDYVYYGKEWQNQSVRLDTICIIKALFARVNESSALYQQPGFLGDVLVIGENRQSVQWYNDVPMAYVVDNGWCSAKEYWIIVLDYGHNEAPDPFNIERFPHSKGGDDSTFLHPILRRYRNGQLVSEHHVSQDLENDWNGPRFEVPLKAFLDQEMVALGLQSAEVA